MQIRIIEMALIVLMSMMVSLQLLDIYKISKAPCQCKPTPLDGEKLAEIKNYKQNGANMSKHSLFSARMDPVVSTADFSVVSNKYGHFQSPNQCALTEASNTYPLIIEKLCEFENYSRHGTIFLKHMHDPSKMDLSVSSFSVDSGTCALTEFDSNNSTYTTLLTPGAVSINPMYDVTKAEYKRESSEFIEWVQQMFFHIGTFTNVLYPGASQYTTRMMIKSPSTGAETSFMNVTSNNFQSPHQCALSEAWNASYPFFVEKLIESENQPPQDTLLSINVQYPVEMGPSVTALGIDSGTCSLTKFYSENATYIMLLMPGAVSSNPMYDFGQSGYTGGSS